MRRALVALCLAFGAAAPGGCGGTPTSSRAERTLARFEPHLTRDLTPAAARSRFGAPDEETGSGLRIYEYRLGNGRTLWLAFPGDAPITYARIEAKDGTFSDVTLR